MVVYAVLDGHNRVRAFLLARAVGAAWRRPRWWRRRARGFWRRSRQWLQRACRLQRWRPYFWRCALGFGYGARFQLSRIHLSGLELRFFFSLKRTLPAQWLSQLAAQRQSWFWQPQRFGFRGNYYGWGRRGWGYGYPYWGWGYYDPWLWDWWGSDNSSNDDYYQNLDAANEMNQQSLEEQREEQQMFRQEQAEGDQDAYAPSYRTPPNRTPQYSHSSSNSDARQGDPIMPETVLVYRDQHKQEIQNYAIVGQTLWNFAPQHTQRIPLSELDLTATIKANEDQGVTFRVPSIAEGQ